MIKERFNLWVAETLSIQNILSGKTPKIYQFSYDKYLSDNPSIKKHIKSLKNGLHLVIAAPGTGKTYSIVDVFRDSKDINIIFVPNKSQALQIGENYNILSITGGKEVLKQDFKKNNNAVFVYDKASPEEFRELFLKYPSKKINIVIDEAHNLVSSSGYRNEAIKFLDQVKEMVLHRGGKVIEMTASPQTMGLETFDTITHLFPSEEYKAPTKSINLYVNTSNNKDFLDFTYEVMNKVGKSIIRYQSKDAGQALSWYLNNIDNKKAFYVNADTKEYFKVGDKTKFKNEMFDSIINKEILPKGDFFIQTSINDAGINIIDIEDDKKENLNTIFAVLDSSQTDTMNIEQFSNRLRFESNSMNILINENNKKQPIKSYFTIIKEKYFVLEKQLKYLNLKLDALCFKYDLYENNTSINRMKIKNQFEYELDFTDLDGNKDSLGCIYIDEALNILFDKKLFFLNCWEEYTRQFYNNIDEFIKELKMIFNRDINIIQVEDVKKYDILNEFYKYCIDCIDFGDIEEIKNTKIYANYLELTDKQHLSKDEALEILNKDIYKGKKEISAVDTIKNKNVKAMIKDLKPADLNKIEMCFKNRDLMTDEKFKAPRNEIKQIIDSNYYDYIKKCNKMNYEITTLLKLIQETETYSDLDNYFNEMQYISINIKYKSNEELETYSEKEQKIVLDKFFKADGKPRNIKITKAKINEIQEEMLKTLNRSYSQNKILKFMVRLFKISNSKVPTSLITKYDKDFNFEKALKDLKKNLK